MIGASGGNRVVVMRWKHQHECLFVLNVFFHEREMVFCPGLYCLVAASISTWILNWKEDAAIFFTRLKVQSYNYFLFPPKVPKQQGTPRVWGKVDEDSEDDGSARLLCLGLRVRRLPEVH